MIVDNELIGYGAVKDDEASTMLAHHETVPIFTGIEQAIRKNLVEFGDSGWMVIISIIFASSLGIE